MGRKGAVLGRPGTGLAIRGGLVLNGSMKPIETSLEQALLHVNNQARRESGILCYSINGRLGLSG